MVDEMVVEEATSSSSSSSWSWEQEKAFENALVVHFEEDGSVEDDHWELIAEEVPGKSVEEVKRHFELLVEDVNDIEAGLVPMLSYASSSEGAGEDGGGHGHGHGKKGSSHGGESGHGGKGSRTEQERRKGVAWTEDEHRLFLLGLDKYGKGDWRSISRNFVISRTPTQVASHAQKYFIRLNSMNKDRRRASIHDITSVGNNAEDSAAQGPITGQANAPPLTIIRGGKPSTNSSPQHPPPPPPPPPPGTTTTTIGQPVGGPAVVGTPVNLSVVPGVSHMGYGVRAPVGTPGAPMNLTPMNYQLMHHTSAHR